MAVQAGRHKIRCRYVMIATHTPLMGKTGLVSATLFQSKLALYTSYVVGAKVAKGVAPEALYRDTQDPYYYLRIDPQRDHDYAIFGGEDCKPGRRRTPKRDWNGSSRFSKRSFPTPVSKTAGWGRLSKRTMACPSSAKGQESNLLPLVSVAMVSPWERSARPWPAIGF